MKLCECVLALLGTAAANDAIKAPRLHTYYLDGASSASYGDPAQSFGTYNPRMPALAYGVATRPPRSRFRE